MNLSYKQNNKSEEFDACWYIVQNLAEKKLPVVFSLEHLAIQMGIQSDYLRNLIGDGKKIMLFIIMRAQIQTL
jgi:RNA-directed DNA polymerase